MTRITKSNLKDAIGRLNTLTNSPLDYYHKSGAIAVDHFGLYQAYGMVQLVRTTNAGGGVRDIQPVMGTKRECYDFIRAMIKGIELAKQ